MKTALDRKLLLSISLRFLFFFLILLTLLGVCYCLCVIINFDFHLLLVKVKSMLLAKSLYFLLNRLGWFAGGLFIAVIFALLDPETVGYNNMMAPSGASGDGGSSSSSSKQPSIPDLNLPAGIDEAAQKKIKIGNLIFQFRKEEKIRRAASDKVAEIVNRLEEGIGGAENLSQIIEEMEGNRLGSKYYRMSKEIYKELLRRGS